FVHGDYEIPGQYADAHALENQNSHSSTIAISDAGQTSMYSPNYRICPATVGEHENAKPEKPFEIM
ncbi:MAG: hypothetical protein KUA38_00540, partial [Hydrogenophaga sp.]|nr:hypothetical protein [Hydrogenophaga sp.]